MAGDGSGAMSMGISLGPSMSQLSRGVQPPEDFECEKNLDILKSKIDFRHSPRVLLNVNPSKGNCLQQCPRRVEMERAKATFQEVISVEMDVQTPGSGGARGGLPVPRISSESASLTVRAPVLIIFSCSVMVRDLCIIVKVPYNPK